MSSICDKVLGKVNSAEGMESLLKVDNRKTSMEVPVIIDLEAEAYHSAFNSLCQPDTGRVDSKWERVEKLDSNCDAIKFSVTTFAQ